MASRIVSESFREISRCFKTCQGYFQGSGVLSVLQGLSWELQRGRRFKALLWTSGNFKRFQKKLWGSHKVFERF